MELLGAFGLVEVEILPDVVNYQHAISACERSAQREWALELWKSMRTQIDAAVAVLKAKDPWGLKKGWELEP